MNHVHMVIATNGAGNYQERNVAAFAERPEAEAFATECGVTMRIAMKEFRRIFGHDHVEEDNPTLLRISSKLPDPGFNPSSYYAERTDYEVRAVPFGRPERKEVSLWQLAPDEQTYGEKASWWVIVTPDGEHELPGGPFSKEEQATRHAQAMGWRIVPLRIQ